MPHYFAYGSNMSRARLEARLGPVRDLGRARCPDRHHRFSKLGRDGTGKGNIEVLAGALVWGVVYELGETQLERLAKFEFGYRGTLLDLGLAEPALERGGAVRAASFEALTPVAGLAPTRAYLEHYVAGIREHGIPEAYANAVLAEFADLLA
jgi:gamma-glutamylcyclotransferase